MTELAAAKIIVVDKLGRRVVYRMNPSIAWRGREATRITEARGFEPA